MALTRIGTNSIKDLSIEKLDLNDRIVDVNKLEVDSWSDGQILSIDSEGKLVFINRADAGEVNLTDLGDVTIFGPNNGQALIYNGSIWVNGNVDYTMLTNVPPTFPPSFHEHLEAHITDLDKYTKAEVDQEITNAVANKSNVGHLHTMSDVSDATWISDITGSTIGELSDVDLTTPPVDGQVLAWNVDKFEPVDVESDVHVIQETVPTPGEHPDGTIIFVVTP